MAIAVPQHTTSDDEQTEALAAAMLSVATNLPQAAAELAEGRLSPARQRILAGLLRELGGLLQEHADLTDLSPAPTGTGRVSGS